MTKKSSPTPIRGIPGDPPGRSGETEGGEASLDDALDHLERMLQRRERAADYAAANYGSAERLPGEQYTIPLLDDVVMPGEEISRRQPRARAVHALQDPTFIERDAECQEVIRRLSNEIEVIIQGGVEEALRNANEDIMERVKRHIEITLPELLEAIADIRARKNP